MTGMVKTAVVVSVCGAAFFGLGADARASVTKHDNFGNAGSWFIIGRDPNDGNSHWLGWQRKSDGACAWENIGGSGGLTDNYWLYGDGGDDNIIIVPSAGITFCGFFMQAPTQNGYRMNLFGGDGNDYLSTNGGIADLQGGAGNDSLYTWDGTGWNYGEAGNDLIIAPNASGSGGYFNGGADNDCIYVNSGQSPWGMDCGSGTDQWQGPGSRPASCETTVTNCCGGIDDCP